MSYQSGSAFGRIPPETVRLFEQTIRTVRGEIVTALPQRAGSEVRAATLEMLLDVILRDWRENGNTTGLLASDVADLRNFVALAASLAADDLNGASLPVFQATLKGLLEDWLANWNAPGDPGPPGPIN